MKKKPALKPNFFPFITIQYQYIQWICITLKCFTLIRKMISNLYINLRAFSTSVHIFRFLTRSTLVPTWSEPERTGPHILFGTPSDLVVCPLHEGHYNPHSRLDPVFRNLRLPRSTPCPRPSGPGSGHPCSHRLPVPPAHGPRPWPNWIKVKIRSFRIKTSVTTYNLQ